VTSLEFKGVYKAYFNDVFLYIKKLSGSETIAEDITSETFLKALKSIDHFRGECDIQVWLCQIAKNCYYSYMKRNSKIDSLEKHPEQADTTDIAQQVVNAYASMKIYTVLHHLDEPYKEVFMLRTLGELSFRQIGRLFGKSENWACVTYHRAKAKIQNRMEDYK
jgi:RNA polymerase sigma factor (sigma-70 family)